MPSAPVYACQFWKACHSSRSCSKACAPNLLTRLQSLSTPKTCPCFPASENWRWRGIIMFSISRYTRFKYHTSVSSVRVWVLPTRICKMHVHGVFFLYVKCTYMGKVLQNSGFWFFLLIRRYVDSSRTNKKESLIHSTRNKNDRLILCIHKYVLSWINSHVINDGRNERNSSCVCRLCPV
jgi:hypothetical protein